MNGPVQSSSLVREMRPTLIVGLGGTGQDVLVRIKARFLETFGPDALDVVKLVALDTVSEGFQVSLPDGRVIKLDRNTELIDIGNVPTVQVLQNLDYNFPTIKAWLPRDLPGQLIVAGAKQIRPMGRLAFFYHFRRIRDQLEQLITGMANINRSVRTDTTVASEDVEGTHMFVVSSVCGGTGSGVFLDTAYLLRSLCARLNTPNVHITGMLVLPQAFAQVPSEQIKANAYAALLELDHFTNGTLGNNFRVEYPGNITVTDPLRPFNICYLVDGVNERGRTLAGMPELGPLIAESIFLQISSRIGRQAASAFDNLRSIDGVFTDLEGLTHPTAYSGFGMSSLIFPAARITDVCGRRFAARLINEGLLSRAPENAVINQEIESFLERSELRSDTTILTLVSRDEQGRALVLRPDQGGLSMPALESLAKPELPSQFNARRQNFEAKVLNDSLRKSLDSSFARLQKTVNQQLDQDVARLLDDPERGLPLIDPFLEQLRATLSDTLGRLDASRKEKQEGLARNTAAIQTNTQRLYQAMESWVDLRGTKRKQALQALLNTHIAQFTFQFDIMRLDYAIRLLSVVINQIDVQRREAGILVDQLHAAAAQFQKFDENETRRWDSMQNAREQVITDSRDLEVLYSTYVRDVGQQLTRLTDPTEAGPIAEWRKKYPTYEDISTQLLRFAQSVFQGVANVRLEDEIMRKREVVAPEVRLEQLRSTSIPFWSIQLARVPDGGSSLETVQVIAVENKDSTIFQEESMLRGTVTTTTLDKHRLTVLQTRHGVPMTAIAQIDDYRRLYEQYGKMRNVPLHIFPIRDPRKARTLFALGEAFGFIARDGAANYSLANPDPLKEPAQLGQGIEEAIRRFGISPDLISRVETMIDGQVKSKGGVEAGKIVDAYIDRPLSRSERLQVVERELKTLAREHRLNYFL